MSAWKLTVRHGSEVEHEAFGDLGEAVVEMRLRALEIRAEGPPPAAKMLREFKPADQVKARLELSAGGALRKRRAGIDVRGDGTFLPYRGGLRREELDPAGYETPFDLVRETLERD